MNLQRIVTDQGRTMHPTQTRSRLVPNLNIAILLVLQYYQPWVLHAFIYETHCLQIKQLLQSDRKIFK